MLDIHWHLRFLKLAEDIAQWSKDPSTKVGAVIVDPETKQIISTGYNGFPAGMPDRPELYLDRTSKYSRIVHGEMNAILSANRSVRGSSLYLSPFICCDRCAVHVIQAGIKEVYAPVLPTHLEERWSENLKLTREYFNDSDVYFKEFKRVENT